MTERLVSLAAGTVLDVGPEVAVDVAAAAGFGAVGLWFDGAVWDEHTTRQVARRLRRTGLTALDIEPVILGRGPDDGVRMISVAADLGVRFVLVASGSAERAQVVERLGELCDIAASADLDLRIVLEFLPIFTVASLDAAVSVVEEVGMPNAGVLVDTLHLARSGGKPEDLLAVPAGLLPYLQIADAPAVAPTTSTELREEALHGRLLPGEGALPLGEVLDAVGEVPLSVELRSRDLLDRYPDPTDRARAVLQSTQRLLAGRESRQDHQ